MTEQILNFDPADTLETREDIGLFLAAAFETGDAGHIANAIGIVARSQGMAEIAQETGLSREQLYRSLSEQGNPTLKTALSVLGALGFIIIPRAA